MSDRSDYMLIFAASEPEMPQPSVSRGLRDTVKRAAANASEVAVSTLQENVRCFIKSLDTILSSSPKDVGGLTLDEVQIHAELDGKGNIGISGIAAAEFGTKGGIKFVLRKKM